MFDNLISKKVIEKHELAISYQTAPEKRYLPFFIPSNIHQIVLRDIMIVQQQYNFLHTMTAYITYKTHHHHLCIYVYKFLSFSFTVCLNNRT